MPQRKQLRWRIWNWPPAFGSAKVEKLSAASIQQLSPADLPKALPKEMQMLVLQISWLMSQQAITRYPLMIPKVLAMTVPPPSLPHSQQCPPPSSPSPSDRRSTCNGEGTLDLTCSHELSWTWTIRISSLLSLMLKPRLFLKQKRLDSNKFLRQLN